MNLTLTVSWCTFCSGRCRLYAITNSSASMLRRPCGTGMASASFIAAARAWRMTSRNSAKSSHPSLKSERLSLRRTVSLTRYRPADKARRRLARNLAQSPPASLQAAAGEISSARYLSAGHLIWIKACRADFLSPTAAARDKPEYSTSFRLCGRGSECRSRSQLSFRFLGPLLYHPRSNG